MRLILKGVQPHWCHSGLVSLIGKLEGLEEGRIRAFLSRNNMASFNDLETSVVLSFLEDLEKLGFDVQLETQPTSITACIGMTFDRELDALKREVGRLSARLQELEAKKNVSEASAGVKTSKVYQQLAAETRGEGAPAKARGAVKMVQEKVLRSGETNESNIGKYWLSRIGVFTLALGVVLFISYSFQFIGPVGKLLTGAAVALALLGLGNYLSGKEPFRRWSMAAIGGGWAILYFTVYAAHQIPATKIIQDPLVAFLFLALVMVGSIRQSLKFRSAALVFFSYFLAYVAITMVGVTFYTLAASFLLAVSIVIVTRRTGWTWLAPLGLGAVYLTHAVWVQQVLAGAGALTGASLYDICVLPWAGEAWRIYPLITLDKSLLHLAFLVLYWILFATLGFFKDEKLGDENIRFWLLLANNLIFTASFIHHLHVYHPGIKFVFPLVMGTVFLALARAEEVQKRNLLSDLYLASGTALFALAVPLYFRGPWITYGWSAGCVLLSWLGLRHRSALLYRIGWVLGGLIAVRLYYYDYSEQEALFKALFTFRVSFFIFSASALAFLANYFLYQRSAYPAGKEKRAAENCFLIAACAVFACGVLVGGLRSAGSVLWLLEGIGLLWLGIRQTRRSLRVASAVVSVLAALRFMAVDFHPGIMSLFQNFHRSLRLTAAGLSIAVILGVGDWLRRAKPTRDLADVPVMARWWSIMGAMLLMLYVYDPRLSSWISMLWGGFAFLFICAGFGLRERLYRWIGLGMFSVVLLRLFIYDFAHLQTIYRIVSFIGLGIVLIGASFFYNYYSEMLPDTGKKENSGE